ncbi:carbohydrate ABC transporter permease [Anaerosacchariphilus polymeriproducens]|uniref:Maltose/maltodextrin transport system permease protein n=1 Tax=Anaerosacchariphilus polymeriproducens TaxID=1812858 RepID=A0A371AXB1_9FIRM|nr:sugar ABC transporter permease [Anaerosacchariphilus polymeriproducens]RDU24171.1 sugar ABC transporter permease [Anaerosacchariphilus polymeriproducens]
MNKKKTAFLLSMVLWGSGQFFICKQRLKGVLLFAFQLLPIIIELFTGYWLEYAQGLITDFSIRLHGGFFTKGIWGLITLGEKAGGRYGDHSTILLINGIMAVIILLLLLVVYIWNLWDAWNSAKYTGKVFPYLILVPIGIAFFFVVIMPIVFTFLTAFLNYNRDHLPPGQLLDWVGINNFKKLFTVSNWFETFSKVLIWTVIWTLASTFGTYFLGLFQAVILNHKAARGTKIYRTILILPWAIPQMVSLLVFRNLLNGQFSPINQFLLEHGLIRENIPFLSDPLTAKVTVIVVSIWLGFPMFMVMMSGILANMDQSLYEAASLDGANRFQCFFKITLPLVFKATMPNLIMTMAANFNGFGLIYFLTQGGPANANMQFAGDTDILISWIYKLTLDQKMFDIAAVMSVLLFFIVGVVSLWNFRRTVSFKEL